VAMKNITDFGLTTVIFWAFGFAFMFGGSSLGGWLGTSNFFPSPSADFDGTSLMAFLLFQVMFCGTAVTILSGAIAERLRFEGYIIITVLISGFVYPIFGHWAWGGIQLDFMPQAIVEQGWLLDMGFVDFAGSTVVHSVGGWASLAILLVVGSRTGRFGDTPRAIQGANLPVAVLGVMLLWVGWFGFNGGSNLAISTEEDVQRVILIITNTTIAGSTGLLAAMVAGWIINGRARVELIMNGTLAGLVAITAGCHAVNTAQAAVIGGVGGLVMFGTTILLERLQIDDAVGAIPVHLGAGVWGTLAVAFFASPALLYSTPEEVAAFNRFSLLLVQLLGIVVCGVWVFSITYLVIRISNNISPLRVSEADEKMGLNVSEHDARTDLLDMFTVMDEQSHTGDLSLRVPVEPFTEIGLIAEHYNEVLDAFEKAMMRTDSIVRIAMDGIITFSRDTFTIISVNPAAEAILGYTGSELQDKPIYRLLASQQNPADLADTSEFTDVISSLMKSDTYREIVGKRANGTTFPMEVNVTEVTGRADQEGFFTATFRDITQRKAFEDELFRQNQYLNTLHGVTLAMMNRLEKEELLHGIIANAAGMMHTFQGYVYLVTPSGQYLEMVVGTGVFEKFVGTRLAFNDGLAGRVFHRGEGDIIDNYSEWSGRAGVYEKEKFGSAIAVPLFSGFEPMGVFGMAHVGSDAKFTKLDLDLLTRFSELTSIALDNANLYESAQQEITERKRIQEELEEARDAAEAANKAKSSFLANMSHELRTPLNAIIGYSEMLQEDAEDFGYDDFVPDLSKIRSAGSHLLDLINNNLGNFKLLNKQLHTACFDFGEVENVVNQVKQ
ncbi:MAG: ammonium transporter, partial [Chloroflexota bacterium]